MLSKRTCFPIILSYYFHGISACWENLSSGGGGPGWEVSLFPSSDWGSEKMPHSLPKGQPCLLGTCMPPARGRTGSQLTRSDTAEAGSSLGFLLWVSISPPAWPGWNSGWNVMVWFWDTGEGCATVSSKTTLSGENIFMVNFAFQNCSPRTTVHKIDEQGPNV